MKEHPSVEDVEFDWELLRCCHFIESTGILQSPKIVRNIWVYGFILFQILS